MDYCQGIKKDGDPCGCWGRLVWSNGYCEFHQHQTNWCNGTTKAGNRCKKLAGCNGFCKWHDPEVLWCEQPKKDGTACQNIAGECPHHAKGRIPISQRTEPSIFRMDDLRAEKWSAVKEYRGGVDAYSKVKVGSKSNRKQEVDHVIECQVVRDAFDLIPTQGKSFKNKKDKLAKALSSGVVNNVENLNITSAITNEEKCKAIQEFQNVYLDRSTDNPELGLLGYLMKNLSLRDKSLSRVQTRAISNEIWKSWEAFEDCIEHEQPLHEDFSSLLHKNIVAMKLK